MAYSPLSTVNPSGGQTGPNVPISALANDLALRASGSHRAHLGSPFDKLRVTSGVAAPHGVHGDVLHGERGDAAAWRAAFSVAYGFGMIWLKL